MHVELQLLIKQEVSGPVVQTSRSIKLVGYNGYLYESNLKVFEGLDVSLTDAVKAYLHRSIANAIYMKILERFKLPEANSTNPRNM